MLNRILVAIDESSSSEEAFGMALAMAKGMGSHLILVHVLDLLPNGTLKHPFGSFDNGSMVVDESAQDNYDQHWDKLTTHYDKLLKQKQAEAAEAGVTAIYVQPHGHPGPAICAAASTHRADLIVVGNRDRSNQQELILGSVSNYLVHHAPCSVTVIHPTAYSEPANREQYSEFASVGMA
ncbi:MAG: universal stress protein [Phormidesmis sp. RL_2_1]|nr:universal stress protein [Phormidesmis sp. RL_2_1]